MIKFEKIHAHNYQNLIHLSLDIHILKLSSSTFLITSFTCQFPVRCQWSSVKLNGNNCALDFRKTIWASYLSKSMAALLKRRLWKVSKCESTLISAVRPVTPISCKVALSKFAASFSSKRMEGRRRSLANWDDTCGRDSVRSCCAKEVVILFFSLPPRCN